MSLNEQHFYNLIDASPDACLIVSHDGAIIYLNHIACELFGYTADEILGQKIEVLIPDRYRKLHPQHRTVFNETGASRAMGEGIDLFAIRKNGVEFSIEVSLSAIKVDDGSLIMATVRDITHQKIRESTLTGILERSVNEIYIFDAISLKFITVNQSARENLGYSSESLNDMTPVDIKPDYDETRFTKLLKKIKGNTQAKFEFETIHQRADGSRYPVEINLQYMQFESRPVYVAISQDMSDHQAASDAIEMNKLVLNASTNGIVIFEIKQVEGKNIGTIIYCNNAYVEMTGYTSDEIIGSDASVMLNNDFEQAGVKETQAAFNKEQAAKVILRVYRKSGEMYWNEVTLSPVHSDNGELTHFISINQDITNDIEAKEVLEQTVTDRTQELYVARHLAEKSTASKSRFLAAASHDLRQPLQSINLYISALNRRTNSNKNKEILGKIEKSSETMRTLLDALLDISQLESGSVKPTFKSFQLNNLFENVQASLQPLAEEKGLKLTSEATNQTLFSDIALLSRIVDNFVTNAIRYTDSGGVTLKSVDIGNSVRIEIHDTGAGIAEQEQQAIFEEYYQLDNDERDRNEGLGLGLSIVKHIAKLLDLKLNVQSSLGKGSVFSVEVPLAEDKTSKSQDTKVRTNSPTHKITNILVIDDDPAILDATTLLLESEGFLISSAANATEVESHLQNGIRPDFIISDYRLPGKNGIEVVKDIRAHLDYTCPVVLMTGDTSSSEITSQNLSACTVLHKPVDVDQLIEIVNTNS